MKSIILLLLTFFALFSCVPKSNKKAQVNNNAYNIEATYTPYLTAMGKGKGIIFRVNILKKNISEITVDSFYVNNKSLPFIVNNKNGFIEIESNYLVNKESPLLTPDNKLTVEKEIDDPIILDQKFYPSWIIISTNNGKIKLNIESYKNKK